MPLLKYFTLLIFSLDSSAVIVEPNIPHISDLLVSHYDSSKRYILREFSFTRVQPCAQAPSALESTRANVFVRAKAKRLEAWTCEAYVKRKNFVFTQTDNNYCRHDATDYHQSTIERPHTLKSTECKHAIRHLNATDNPQPNAFEYSNFFIFFDDIQKQRFFETKKPLF